MKETSSSESLSFWSWAFRGTGAGPGFRRFRDWWLVMHLAVGLLLAWLVPVSLADAANTVLLPLAGIFIGLSFAWAGNAQALLQASEIEDLATVRAGGFAEYVFMFQLAVLSLLVAVVLWGLAGLRLFDEPCPWACPSAVYFFTEVTLYGVASLALRECWNVVVGAQALLMVRRRIRQSRGGSA